LPHDAVSERLARHLFNGRLLEIWRKLAALGFCEHQHLVKDRIDQFPNARLFE
jgi:hypothetical protein